MPCTPIQRDPCLELSDNTFPRKFELTGTAIGQREPPSQLHSQKLDTNRDGNVSEAIREATSDLRNETNTLSNLLKAEGVEGVDSPAKE